MINILFGMRGVCSKDKSAYNKISSFAPEDQKPWLLADGCSSSFSILYILHRNAIPHFTLQPSHFTLFRFRPKAGPCIIKPYLYIGVNFFPETHDNCQKINIFQFYSAETTRVLWLFMPQRFYGILVGGLARRIHAKDNPHTQGNAQ